MRSTLSGRAAALALDNDDPLKSRRGDFLLPPGVIYLDGNSLGALHQTVPARVDAVLKDQWGQGLIRSWNSAGWIDLPARVGARIARLIGARADEVIVADSTSINVFKLLSAALQMRPHRRVILSEDSNFPTDLYIAEGLSRLTGRAELKLALPDRVMDAIDDDVAVVMLTEVDFRTGRRFVVFREVERARMTHPAGEGLLRLSMQVVTDIEKGGRPRSAVQVLVAAADREIGLCVVEVDRKGTGGMG